LGESWDRFGLVWIDFDKFGWVWDRFGYGWIGKDMFGYVWICLDRVG
jgi:hypothetical protein